MTINAELFLQGVTFLSSVLLGMTGFGNVMLALPLMLLVVEPRTAIPVLKITSLIGHVFTLIFYRFPVDWHLLWKLTLPAAVGTALGTLVLRWADPHFLLLAVTCTITGFALLSLANVGRAKSLRVPAMGVGLLAGIIGGSVALSGPPIALFLSNEHGDSKNLFRGTIIVFFVFEILMTLIWYLFANLLSWEQVALSLRLVPVSLIGIIIGMRVFARFSDATFRKVIFVLSILLTLFVVISRQDL